MKKKIEKIYFVHRGAHFCEISIFAQSEITRPFHKIKAWNKKEKIFFYHFKHKNLKKTWNFFFRAKFFFLSQNLKNVYGRLFFWDDLDVQFQLQLNSIAKRKKCHLEKVHFFDWNTFFQKNLKFFFFLEVWGGVKKNIFCYFLNWVINILP